MALPVTIPNQFANATSSIPLSQLDTNFNTLSNAVNGINSGAETLANLVATTANVTTGNITTVNATTVDTTNIEVTNIKAKDGTASATIADSTGVMTIASSVLTTTDINGGTLDNVVIGGATANAATFTSITDSGNLTFTGTGNRITGDFSNATAANRVMFQSSTTNGNSWVSVLPNGTGLAGYDAYLGADPANSTIFRMYMAADSASLRVNTTGTGSNLPMTFYTGGSEVARITETGGYLRMASGTGGIQFNGDTAAANALDDYEEGTFTPTAVGGTTAGTTTYTAQFAYYTKIGRQVNVTLLVAWSALTGTGTLRIGNLPFTIANLTQNNPIGSVLVDNLNWGGGTYIVAEGSTGNGYLILLYLADDGAAGAQQCVNETAGIRVTMTYFTD